MFPPRVGQGHEAAEQVVKVRVGDIAGWFVGELEFFGSRRGGIEFRGRWRVLSLRLVLPIALERRVAFAHDFRGTDAAGVLPHRDACAPGDVAAWFEGGVAFWNAADEVPVAFSIDRLCRAEMIGHVRPSGHASGFRTGAMLTSMLTS